MNMIEQMARVICAKMGRDPDKVMHDYEGNTWPLWVQFQEVAKAVLEAIREPTEGMCEAGLSPMYQWVDETPDDVWPRMIDAALEGK